MPPIGNSPHTFLSPAELSYLHSSLCLQPPIRPDLRTSTQFRPLVAETDVLPTANGSARVCFSDGTESIVGVKAELEKSPRIWSIDQRNSKSNAADYDTTSGQLKQSSRFLDDGVRSDSWLEVSVEIPGFREDDNLPVFLSAMLSETLLTGSTLRQKLRINDRWHWKLHVDVLLVSPPLSYPLPLLSLTVHLALLHTILPRVTSEPSDDPLFDDDWAAAVPLYPQTTSNQGSSPYSVYLERPPIILLVMSVGDNIIFDPSKEELLVAETVFAVSASASFSSSTSDVQMASGASRTPPLKLLAIRTVDTPSRLTPPGIPDSMNPATNPGTTSIGAPGSLAVSGKTPQQVAPTAVTEKEKEGVWSPPVGGTKRALLARMIKMVIEKDGVGAEVMAGLSGVVT